MAFFDIFRKLVGRGAPDSERLQTAPEPPERRRQVRPSVVAGTSVLIVDDSKTVVAALGKMLSQNGFVIHQALDGETALEILRTNKPDLIFLDIILPKMSGFDVLRRVRRSQYVGKTPVIMMSGNDLATEQYYVRRIGANDFMKKPFSRAQVFACVERQLGLPALSLQSGASEGAEQSPSVVM
jgi:twitching motility two-component system response regulator PilH